MSEARPSAAAVSNGSAKPSMLALLAAFAAVYVLWGSTYLGIRFSMETLPPFFTQGIRFLLAGIVLFVWARLRGDAMPTRREWAGSTITGIALSMVHGGPVFSWLDRVHRVTGVVVTIAVGGHVLVAVGVLPGYRGVWRSMHLGGRMHEDTARRLWPAWTERRNRTPVERRRG